MTATDSSKGATGATRRFDIIEKLRRGRGMSIATLADRVGVDPSTIWRYEQQGMKPAIDVAGRIATVLGVTLDELIPGKPTSTAPSSPPGPESG